MREDPAHPKDSTPTKSSVSLQEANFGGESRGLDDCVEGEGENHGYKICGGNAPAGRSGRKCTESVTSSSSGSFMMNPSALLDDLMSGRVVLDPFPTT